MVFGWGNKKSVESTRVERTSANQNISLSDVPQIISDLSKLRESQTLSEIKNLRNNTAPLIDDLMKLQSFVNYEGQNSGFVIRRVTIANLKI